MADDGWVDTDTGTGQGQVPSGTGQDGWKDTDAAPVTAGGVTQQLGRGAESAPYHVAGAPVDIATENADQWNFAHQAGQDLWHLITTGQYGDKPTMPTRTAPVPGGSDWMMQQAGKISPQLDPRNYPAQNWPEKIARGTGDVGTQALLGRVAGFGGTALTKGPSALPSAVTIGKQLVGSTVGGAGAGAGSQIGRGVASRAIGIDPDFQKLHPAMTNLIEGLGGTIGGGVGGLTASGVANRAGWGGGAPAADLSSGQLESTAKGQYTIARNIPANYTVPAISKFAFDHTQTLLGNYGSSEIGPLVSRLNKLANVPAGAISVPLTELTALDDYLDKVVEKNQGSKLGSAAADTQQAIRNFIKNPPPQSTHSGRPDLAAQYWNTADGNWAAAERSKTIELAQKQGARKGDVEAQVEKLTDPGVIDKKLWGMSPGEKEQLDRFSQGTTIRNALGAGSHFLTEGKEGLGSAGLAALGGYEHFGWPGLGLGLVPPVVGYGLSAGRKALANRALNKIAAQTRQRSPAYQAIPTADRAASPFRTTIPVGLGALSGLSDQ
jgi:hypothetical protein